MIQGDLSEVTAVGVKYNIDGKTYIFEPLTVEDMADFMSHIRSESIRIFKNTIEKDTTPQQCPICNGTQLVTKPMKQNGKMTDVELTCTSCQGRGYIIPYYDTIRSVLNETVTLEKVTEQMFTIEGGRFLIWKSLQHANPDFKIEDVSKIFRNDNSEEMFNILDMLASTGKDKDKDKEKTNKKKVKKT